MAIDSFKFNWPTIRGREDMRVAVRFWTDSSGTVEYDLSVFDRFATSAHNDDDTSSSDLPIATGLAETDTVGGTITNKLVVTYSSTQTELLQESGFTNGKIDIWGLDPSGVSGRIKLAEATWAMDRAVTVEFT